MAERKSDHKRSLAMSLTITCRWWYQCQRGKQLCVRLREVLRLSPLNGNPQWFQPSSDAKYLLMGGEVRMCTSGTKANSRYLVKMDSARFQLPPTTKARNPAEVRWKNSSDQQMNRPLRLTALVKLRFLMTFLSRTPDMVSLSWTFRWWKMTA